MKFKSVLTRLGGLQSGDHQRAGEGGEKDSSLRRVEQFVFCACALLILLLHMVLFMNAGALWRDEVSSVQLARSSSWGEMFGNLITDSFPALWVTLLRIWSAIGGGGGDDWLRVLSIVIVVATLAALWRNARIFGGAPPLLSLSLVAFNPTIFYWGDSLRAYGLALLLIVLLFGSVWKVVLKPGAATVATAALLALLAAQSNYQNSYLILAVCVAGAVTSFTRKLWWRGVLILAMGFLSALSLLPYIPVIQKYRSAAVIMGSSSDTRWIWSQIAEAFGSGSTIMPAIWLLLLALVLVSPFHFRAGRPCPVDNRDVFHLRLYCSTALVVATVAMFGFIKFAGMPTVSWYYVPFAGLAAVMAESALASLARQGTARWGRLVLSVCVVGLSLEPLWTAAQTRRTNMDLIARMVASKASKDDYVLVHPFYSGISFDYYYKGEAPWCFVPVVPDEKRELYFVAVKEVMTHGDPLRPTLARIEQVLKSGGRVWFVGGFLLPYDGGPPVRLDPAPHPKFGWHVAPYAMSWAMQIGHFTKAHAADIEMLPVGNGQLVSRFEDSMLITASGWKD